MGAVLVMSIAVACSNDDPVEQAPPPDPAPTTIVGTSGTQPPVQVVGAAVSGVGAGLSVADAIASTLEGPLLVNGFIFTEAGDVWLCDSLLRYEPLATDRVRKDRAECNEPRIQVSGINLATVESFEFHEGAGWTNETTQVLGLKIDGVPTVSGTMLAR